MNSNTTILHRHRCSMVLVLAMSLWRAHKQNNGPGKCAAQNVVLCLHDTRSLQDYPRRHPRRDVLSHTRARARQYFQSHPEKRQRKSCLNAHLHRQQRYDSAIVLRDHLLHRHERLPGQSRTQFGGKQITCVLRMWQIPKSTYRLCLTKHVHNHPEYLALFDGIPHPFCWTPEPIAWKLIVRGHQPGAMAGVLVKHAAHCAALTLYFVSNRWRW